ncbi:MAG: SDR family oxidoreductase [Alphaproteobacteria bacterium]|nr:SDR family oxidoreductase [Alphaproteobacteria bacterium]
MAEGTLAGKVALITGGGRGMGRAMALALARAGAKGIVITSSASPAELRVTERDIDDIAGRPCGAGFTADVTDEHACWTAVAETIARFGAVDILINNAGLGMKNVRQGRDPFWKNDVAAWRRLIDTNVNGPFLMARAAAPHMVAAGWGRIINVSKSGQSMIGPNNSPYGPSKAALDAMTLIWAQDLAGTGVTVNALRPGGLTDTTFSRPAAVPGARKAGRPVYLPEDMGPPAVWLASDASAAYSGCRFNAAKWDTALPPDQAAEAARERPVFAAPRRPCAVADAWTEPGTAAAVS